MLRALEMKMEEQIEVQRTLSIDMEMSFVEQEDILKLLNQFFMIYFQNLEKEKK